MMKRRYFLLRRLHSLTGIVPVGLFLIAHLITNSTIVWGAMNKRAGDTAFDRRVGTFQEEVSFINGLPFLLLIEIGLWLSIAFHAVLGVYYATTGQSNARQYGYWGNIRYSLQRLTGYIAIIYIFYHVATLRWGWSFLIPGGVEWSHHYAASTTAAALQGSAAGLTAAGIAISAFYFVGVTASVFHFANGLWTSAITWGITISAGAQRRWAYACAGLGVALMAAAWSSVAAFMFLDQERARETEIRLHGDAHHPGAITAQSANEPATGNSERAMNE